MDVLSMGEAVVEGKILRWGNSYGVRIRAADVEAADLEPGQQVTVRIEPSGDRLDLADVPTFQGGRSDTARRHDQLLGEARLQGESRVKEADEEAGEDREGPGR
jgi:antitoxin component of MazEF toxin-antitoxin module